MNEIERIFGELADLDGIVGASNSVSAKTAYGEHSAKTLVLAGASYFERRVENIILAHISSSTGSVAIAHFAHHHAVSRKFFSLFDFSSKANNINSFLSKFGNAFSDWAKLDLVASGVDKDMQIAFLDFCRLRNNLVHNNYATFNTGKTLNEVKSSFDQAMSLVKWLETAFKRFEERQESTNMGDEEAQ